MTQVLIQPIAAIMGVASHALVVRNFHAFELLNVVDSGGYDRVPLSFTIAPLPCWQHSVSPAQHKLPSLQNMTWAFVFVSVYD